MNIYVKHIQKKFLPKTQYKRPTTFPLTVTGILASHHSYQHNTTFNTKINEREKTNVKKTKQK